MSASPERDQCPECGGRGLRGCGAAWHDGKPDNAPSPANEATKARGPMAPNDSLWGLHQ